MAELTGQTFAGFEVVAKLGQGGMGAVYKARQPLLDRFVALKVMSQQLSGDPAYVARFIREAASAAKLSHPNMVQVFTAGEQGGVYYIVMEFIEGESLSQRLKRVGVIEPVEAIAITLYVAQALQVAWNKAQLIHRDIKPDNIFLSKDGEVKVGDLGLAKSVGAESTEMTQSGMMMGSPHYMSPEQAHASKETDFRTDIYSLGCTLYQLLTGMTPYQADDALGLILKHVNEPAPDLQAILPSCPQPLVALVNKMMAKDRNARHASYDELIAELWQVSDIIGQQQAAATAVMTPTAEHVAMVKPTVVKAATVVPTVEQTIAVVAPPPKEQGFKLVHAVAGIGAVVFLLAGLWFWSPWKQSRTGVSPVQSSTTGQAGRLSYSDAAALKLLGNVFTNSVGGEMVYIPPGEFMMGSTKEEQEWAIQLGPHDTTSYIEGKEPRKTTIGQGFWFERTEVTVGQWKQFVGATRYRTDAEKNGYADSIPSQKGGQWGRVNGASWKDPHFSKLPQDNHPVCCVSWNDAVSFCEWLTEQERKARRLPAGMIVRLPAEAEWEYACRAGTQAKFWWGESPEDGEGRLNWKRNTMDGGSDLIVPVDSYGVRGRNKFGLADMLGNVWEWCLDSFDPMQAHEKCYQNSAFKSHVLRGGSFNYGPSHDRCAARRSHILLHAACVNGFRVCVGVDVTGSVAPAAPITSNQSPISSVSTAAALKLLGNVFTNSVGAEMVYIPPGEFMMGSTKEEQAWALANGAKEEEVKREGEAPRKAAIKQGLWMGRTEVTVGQWKQFVKETSYVTDGEKKGESYVPQGAGKLWALKKGVSWRDPNFEFEMRDDHAVSCISWNDAMAFCEWLDKREQRAGRLVQGYAVRLPKEAEWEYACRAGRQTKFWWGENKEDGKGRLNWSGKDDEYEFVAPVDSFGLGGRNRFGLADMLGNVCEWCLDGYDATQAHEDLWASNSGVRVLRGGSFFSRLGVVRCAARGCNLPIHSSGNMGFRVCYGIDVSIAKTTTSPSSPASAPKEGGILAPPETRVTALTTNPKVGEVFTLNVGSNVTMELMGIPPGEFMLGSTKEEQAWATENGAKEEGVQREGEAPRRTTITQGFWMGRTEVTMGQWKQFVTDTGYKTDAEKKGAMDVFDAKANVWGTVESFSWLDPNFGSKLTDNHPVCCISWNDAVAFCKWLEGRERKTGRLPLGYRVRLPTGAEWEYACRAGMQTRFWWGDSVTDGKGRLNWSGTADGFEFLAPVDSYGERGRNGFGLADMLGNVWEWCEDFFGGDPHLRATRGNSFGALPDACRCAVRTSNLTTLSFRGQGLRVYVGIDVSVTTTTASPSPAAAPKETGILAPPETRVASLTTNPKVGEVYTLNVGSNVTMELMGIPPGEFMMGSTRDEQAWALLNGANEGYVEGEGEQPRKTRINQGFWLARTEVTVGQFKQFVTATGYRTDAEKKGYVDSAPPRRGGSWEDPNFDRLPQDNQPVCCVSWNDTVAFCEWLSEQERKAGRLPGGCKIRLPVEAEWEYACRAGTRTKFWWGDEKESGTGRLNWAGTKTKFRFVSPVDCFSERGRNSFGLADMLGNVYEWVLDGMDPAGAHEEWYRGDPSGHVVRGGSFGRLAGAVRCAARHGRHADVSDSMLGFRVAVGMSR